MKDIKAQVLGYVRKHKFQRLGFGFKQLYEEYSGSNDVKKLLQYSIDPDTLDIVLPVNDDYWNPY